MTSGLCCKMLYEEYIADIDKQIETVKQEKNAELLSCDPYDNLLFRSSQYVSGCRCCRGRCSITTLEKELEKVRQDVNNGTYRLSQPADKLIIEFERRIEEMRACESNQAIVEENKARAQENKARIEREYNFRLAELFIKKRRTLKRIKNHCNQSCLCVRLFKLLKE